MEINIIFLKLHHLKIYYFKKNSNFLYFYENFNLKKIKKFGKLFSEISEYI